MNILITICAVASVAFTITESKLFLPVRDFMKGLHPKLGELFSCSYCLGHWVSFFLISIYRHRLFYSDFWLFDFFVTALVVAWGAGWQCMLMAFVMQKAGK